MSISPRQIFGRLQELKRWQESHEKLLKRSSLDADFEKSSFNHSYSTYSTENSNNSALKNSDGIPQFRDEIKGLPDKNFEELLEEKINEYTESLNKSEIEIRKPKKPFLKKGVGLLKYNLKPDEYKKLIGNKHSNTVIPPKVRPKSVQFLSKPVPCLPARPKTDGENSCTIRKPKNSLRKSTIAQDKCVKKNSSAPCNPSRNTRASNVQKPILQPVENKSNKTGYPKHRKEDQHSINSCRREEYPKDEILQTVENKNNKSEYPKHRKEDQHYLNSCRREEYPKNEILQPVENKINKTSYTKHQKEDSVNFHKQEEFNNKYSQLNDLKVGRNEICGRDSPNLVQSVQEKVVFTPLKIPEMCIKPKGSWCDISVNKFQSDNNLNKFGHSDINTFNDKYTAQVLVQSQWKNGTVTNLNDYTNKMTEVSSSKNIQSDFHEKENDFSRLGARKSLSYGPSDQSLYDKALETELMIFEALERRTEQSGFCSTNTSIIQLLATSPSKFNFRNTGSVTNSPRFEKIIDTEEIESQPVRDRNMLPPIQSDHFDTASEQNEPNFQITPALSNWSLNEAQKHEIEESEVEDETESESESQELVNNGLERKLPTRTSSVTSEQVQMFPSSYSSDSSDESSIIFSEVQRNSRGGVGSRKDTDVSESCASCGFLIRNKIDECQSELDSLKEEKNRIVAIREQMDKEKKQFAKEMKTRRRQFEEQRLKFQLELEEEKKKISEQQTMEKPSRDSRSKIQQKKDRDEIKNLKMELNESKELMKLRETKNAMSMARLRNQVRLLEKSNAELKTENEKLMKENSKLTAQRKTSTKTTETKMLQEIRKNVSKLTEETFKNQFFKTDTSSEDDLRRKLDNGGGKGDSQKPVKNSQGVDKNVTLSYHGHGEGRRIVQNGVENQNIEEKYQSLFGGNEVLIEDGSRNVSNISGVNRPAVGLSKTESLLEDGTKEIKYSNGNVKLISENSTVRYYYASNDTWHTNFPDGTEVIEFPNGQSEKRFKDGKCLVFFPDGLMQTIFPDGTEEVKYPDGSKLLTKKDGDRMLFLSNGQVEIHTKEQKRREYPDGTVKILYPDGSQETRYSNGRIRMKDSKGEIILDTGDNE